MKEPLVSIILAVYNRKQFLTDAIESVLNQAYSNIELIIVDDGSTEDLSEIFSKFEGQMTLITHEENRGLSAALNTGLKAARGEYIDILSDDDGYLPGKIEKQLSVFDQHPDVDIVYTDYQWLKSDGQFVGHTPKKQAKLNRKRNAENLYHSLLGGNFIDAISPLVRRKCYEKIGGFDERLKNLEDWDMWLRMVAAGFIFYYLDEPLVYIRKHEARKSKDPLQNMRQRIRVLYKAFSKRKSLNSQESKNIRNRAYANVFLDYAYAIYKSGNYQDYYKYMTWALKLDPSRATVKAIRRLIKSWLMTRIT